MARLKISCVPILFSPLCDVHTELSFVTNHCNSSDSSDEKMVPDEANDRTVSHISLSYRMLRSGRMVWRGRRQCQIIKCDNPVKLHRKGHTLS